MQKHKAMLSETTLNLLEQVGANIDLARKRRRLSIETICGRVGITSQTYRRLVKGDPGIGMGIVASVLHAMSLEGDLTEVAAPGKDAVGMTMERTHQPKKIRGAKSDELDTDF